MKRASSVAPKDLKGLRALRNNGGLHRGFVVHTGSAPEQLDDDIWALPLSAFTDPSTWSSTPRPTVHQEIITATTSSVFLSQVHDDETFDGLLVSFAEQVAKVYRTETGTHWNSSWTETPSTGVSDDATGG